MDESSARCTPWPGKGDLRGHYCHYSEKHSKSILSVGVMLALSYHTNQPARLLNKRAVLSNMGILPFLGKSK